MKKENEQQLKRLMKQLVTRYYAGLNEFRHRIQKANLKQPRKTKNLMLHRKLFNRKLFNKIVMKMQEKTGKYPSTNADNVTPYTSYTYVNNMEKDMKELNSLGKCAGAQSERCQEIFAERITRQFTTHARTLRKQVSKSF